MEFFVQEEMILIYNYMNKKYNYYIINQFILI